MPVSVQPHHLHHHLHHPHPHQDPPPQLGDGEVVLALEGATLCNSDLHTLTGRSFVILVIFVLGPSPSWSFLIFVYIFILTL